MRTELELEITFGRGGNAGSYTGDGWSEADDGLSWIIGGESKLTLSPSSTPAAEYLMELTILNIQGPVRRLTIWVNGEIVARSDVKDLMRVLGFSVRGGIETIVFEHSDLSLPIDLCESSRESGKSTIGFYRIRLFRILSDEVCSLPILADPEGQKSAEIVSGFESLGDSCEMGVVQRKANHEPMSLLRFTNMRLSHLVQAIDEKFVRLKDPREIKLTVDELTNEYLIAVPAYSMFQHTFIYHGSMDPERIFKVQCRKLETFGDVQIASFRKAERVFCIKRNDRLEIEEVLPLFAAMQRLGPNTLLYIVPSDADHPCGNVEVLEPGLMRGYLDRFADDATVDQVEPGPWIDVFKEAARLTRASSQSRW